MDGIGFAEELNFFDPLGEVKVVGVVERDLLGMLINIDTLNLRKLSADVFDEADARCAVDAGDGDSSLHRNYRESKWESMQKFAQHIASDETHK